jgi:hypothetical protein
MENRVAWSHDDRRTNRLRNGRPEGRAYARLGMAMAHVESRYSAARSMVCSCYSQSWAQILVSGQVRMTSACDGEHWMQESSSLHRKAMDLHRSQLSYGLLALNAESFRQNKPGHNKKHFLCGDKTQQAAFFYGADFFVGKG